MTTTRSDVGSGSRFTMIGCNRVKAACQEVPRDGWNGGVQLVEMKSIAEEVIGHQCFTGNLFLDSIVFLYCSNYYNESSDPPELCDWCQIDEIRSSKHGCSSKKPAAVSSGRSEYSGDKIKQQVREEGSEKGKSPTTGAPSPRTGTRR
ncbi:unnamed protein product [Lactuca saligna]|uniref:Uncharacterized protein n=1 Tax=Lactuca saligna TaxID=75948 RepID=A0AA36E160_LACSI|nr:unnamed protein product [Lactuca saligna]